jgi:hypothetical protein
MNQMAVRRRVSKTFSGRSLFLSKIAAASFLFFKEACHEKDDGFVDSGVTKRRYFHFYVFNNAFNL